MSGMVLNVSRTLALATAAVALAPDPAGAEAWQPTKNVEFIVPAGTGGGADQMARMIQGIIQKNGLMDQSLVVINKSGGAGAEAFLDVKGSAGNPHKIVITLSNLFTTPLATGIPFSWQDITPVGMLALDEFILWVNAKSPYQTTADYVAALKGGDADQDGRDRVQAGGPDHHRRDRAGDRRQDHLHPLQGRRRRRGAAGRRARRLQRQQPGRGGGAVAGRRVAAPVHLRRRPGRLQGADRATASPGPTSRPARRAGSTSSTTCCAASSPRPAPRRSRSRSMST